MMTLRLGHAHERDMIRAAVRVLRAGGVIAFPTETTYGLGCDPRNVNAVKRIFQIKGRDPSKPLLLVATNVMQAKKVANEDAMNRAPTRTLIKTYWPGPLTIVMPVRRDAKFAQGVVPHGEVAVRVSSSTFVQALTHAYGFPIVATSANRSYEPDCRSGRAVAKTFADAKAAPDLILDIGALPRRKPSTVARVRADGSIEILRQGAVRVR